MNIQHYLTTNGQDLYQNWLNSLRDRAAQARITMRVNRVAAGAFGDCRHVGDKRTQQADIDKAIDCWQDYQER